MRTRISKSEPFCGKPVITTPEIFGASPEKPFLLRISVLGERPLRITAEGLPEGLLLDGNLVSGVAREGEYSVTLSAENGLGRCEKKILLKVAPDGMLQTPLLGFTTWNAFAEDVTRDDVENTARLMINLGIAEYGYAYVNLDSSWQGEYGGKLNAIQPNRKFPDIKEMYSFLHSLGFKGGIYSTPFLHAWGCPKDMEFIHGCTLGAPDDRFSKEFGGIGTEHREAENVAQWCEFGVDYLKYDWMPTDCVNADIMKKILLAAPREIAMCVTVDAKPEYSDYWRKNCCSWRCNKDTFDNWENIVERLDTVDVWRGKTAQGHFYDLDMLALGAMAMNGGKCRLTTEEELTAFVLHAFFPSPVQLSMRLSELTESEFNLICNDELLAINQDTLCDYPELVETDGAHRVYSRRLSDGDRAVAVFNLSDLPLCGALDVEKQECVRNVMEKKDCEPVYDLDPHEAAVFRISCGCRNSALF